MKLRIIRYANYKRKWIKENSYYESFYNIVQTQNKLHVIFNSASGAVALIDRDLEINSLTNDNKRLLIENGFLVSINNDEFKEFMSCINFPLLKNPDYFTIIVTTICNANCFYCYEEDYCKRTLTQDDRNKIVDYIAQHIKDKQNFVLDWYGGEPLLCSTDIDDIINQLTETADIKHKNWESCITTNATLFTKELINHAVKYWHLKTAHITIDGTENEHNQRKRVNLFGESAFKLTYNAILELLKVGIYVNLRIHLDNNNKDSFPQILDSISNLFYYNNLHLFPTFLFPPAFDMPKSYLNDSEKENFFYNVFKTLLDSGYQTSIADLFPKPKFNNCFATKANTVVISPDASIHSCVQEFLPEDDLDGGKKFINYTNACIECKECKFFPICLGGCIHNRSLKNTVRTPCVRNRFIVKPLLKLLIERLVTHT